MRKEENEFLKIALEKGYLSEKDVSIIYERYKYANLDLENFLLKNNYLTPDQLKIINKELKVKIKETKIFSLIKRKKSTKVLKKTEKRKARIIKDDIKNNQKLQKNEKIIKNKIKEDEKEDKNEINNKNNLNNTLKNVPFIKIKKGITWKNYKIIKEIGEGGMANVYKAWDTKLNRYVALKILNFRDISEEKILRFQKEAKINSQLEHENIVKVFEGGNYNNLYYIVMEYIDGAPLHKYCSLYPLKLEEFLEIIEKICYALYHAHTKGIVHRDIKPSNILISKEKKPYLVDFGIAKFLDKSYEKSLTKTGQILGTPRYMSPEQALGSKNVDFRTDIYSLGLILYEFVTKRPAVEGRGGMEIIYNIINKKIIPPRKIVKNLDKRLEKIILKAISYKKEDRFKSALEFGDSLKNYLKIIKEEEKRKKEEEKKIRIRKIGISCGIILIFLLIYIFFIRKEKNYIKEIENYYKLGKYSKVLKLIGKIKIEDKNKKLKILKLELKIYEKMKKYGKIKEIWEKIEELYPLNIKVLYFLYESAEKNKEYTYALDYLDKILMLINRIEDLEKRKKLKKELERKKAEILIKIGDLEKAKKYYNKFIRYTTEKKKKLKYLIKIGFIYYKQKNIDKLKKILKNIDEKDLITKEEKGFYYFLKSIIEWKNIEIKLYSYNWLFKNNKYVLKNEVKKIEKKLKKILNELELATKILLDKEIKEFYTGVKVELEIGNKKDLEILKKNNKILLNKILLRYYIKHKKLEECNKLCNKLIYLYPWEGDLYYIKGLVDLFSNELDSLILDIYKYASLNKYNPIYLNTLLFLILLNLDQEKVYTAIQIGTIAWEIEKNIERYIFNKELSYYKKSIFKKEDKIEKKGKYINIKLNKILKILKNFEKSKRLKYIKKILLYYNIEEIEKEINKLNKKSEIEKDIEKEIIKIKTKEKKEKIKEILIRYSIFNEYNYIIDIKKIKGGIKLLKDIYKDEKENPFLRFLSGKILLNLHKIDLFSFIYDKLNSNEKEIKPIQALSFIVLINNNILLPDLSIPYKGIEKLDKFYRIMLALYIFPTMKNFKKIYIKLKNDKNDLVKLFLAYNLRNYKKYTFNKELEDIFLNLIKYNNNPKIRALALEYFWNFDNIGKDINNRKIYENLMKKLIKRYIKHKYFNIFITSLKDKSDKVKIISIVSLLNIFKKFQYTQNIKRKVVLSNSPYIRKIIKKYRKILKNIDKNNENEKLKIWTTFAYSMLKPNKNIIEDIIKNNKILLILRLNGIIQLIKNDFNKIIPLIKFLKLTTNNRKIKLIKGLLMVIAGSIENKGKEMKFYFNLIFSILKSIDKKTKDNYIKKCLITSFSYLKDEIEFSKLSKILLKYYNKKEYLPVNLIGLSILCSPHNKIEKYLEKYKKNTNKILKKKIAFGFYLNIIKRIKRMLFFNRYYYNSKIKNIYNEYLQKFKSICSFEKDKIFQWKYYLKKAIEFYPDPRYYYELSSLYFYGFHDIPNTRKYLYKIINNKEKHKIDFLKAQALLLLALTYLDEDKIKTIQLLKEAEKYDPFCEDIYFNLGILSLQKGYKNKAEKYFIESFLCNPTNNINSLINLIKINFENKNKVIILLKLLDNIAILSKRLLLEKFGPHYYNKIIQLIPEFNLLPEKN